MIFRSVSQSRYKDWAKVATILAERNLSVTMETGIMTSAEVNGKIGGLTKSANQEKQQ